MLCTHIHTIPSLFPPVRTGKKEKAKEWLAIVASALSSDRQNYVHCLATTHKLWQFFLKSEKW